jgi:hypothetical protein
VCQVFVEQLKRVDGERNEEELGVAIDQIITEIQNV